MNFDPENPFQYANKSDPRTMGTYFLSQRYYKLRRDYMAIPSMVSLRKKASVIFKQYAATGARDPVIPYLAMIYFDLFVSAKNVSNLQGISVDINRTPLLITCCFIIAWKMRKPQFCLPEFLIQYNLPYLIDQVEKLELLIDGWLQRPHLNGIPITHQDIKRPVTAICFLDYLIGLVTKLSKDETICLKNFATHKLYALQYDIRYTIFKPSLVAAAAIAFCVDKYYKRAIDDLLDAFLTCEVYNNEKLKLAIEMTVPGLTVETCILSSDDDDEEIQLQTAISISLAESLKIVPPDSSPGESTSTAPLTLSSDDDDDDDEKQLQAALSISLAESLNIVPPDRSPNEGTSTAQLTLSAPDRSPGARADATRMMVPSVDRGPGAYADKARSESSGAQEKRQQQISSLSSSLAAALGQSVVDSRFSRSAPDRSPGARTSLAQLTLSAPDRNRDANADTRRMMLPPANRSQGARGNTRRMVMPPVNLSQGARADNRIDIEMLPPPNRIPTRLGLTLPELPPRKRGITVDQISREAKGKGKLYLE